MKGKRDFDPTEYLLDLSRAAMRIPLEDVQTLLYDLEHPGKIDRMILLSPFVGDEEAIREIDAAGGVRSWKPGVIEKKDFSRKLWLGLKNEWLGQRKRPEVLLACGDKDRLRASNERFSKDFLKPGEVISLSGDHDWPTWRRMFPLYLDEMTRPGAAS